jgi:hypothetical protein
MKFSPSAASRWLTCPGSVPLSDGIESPASEYALEGTGAHQLLEICQRLGVHPLALLGRTLETKDGNIKVTEEMAEAVEVFLHEIVFLPEDTAHIEVFMVSKVVEGLQGTADYCNACDDVLHVYDYKHGAGVPVAAEGNLQLLTYAGLAMERFGDAFDEVVLKIIQPRARGEGGDDAPKVKQWVVSREQVQEHMERVRMASLVARGEQPPLVPGDHCRWCAAKPHCPKLHQLAVSEAKADFRLPAPVELDQQKLLFWLEMGPILEDWLKSVRDFAKREAELGHDIPGWKVVQSIGNRKWSGVDEEIAQRLINQGFHPDDVYEPRKLKGPAQVEKCPPNGMKAKDAKAFVTELTVRPVTGTSLVRLGDGRPAITNTAANDFTRIERK